MGKLGLALIGLTNAWFNKPAEIGAQCVGDNVSNGSDLSADPFTWVGNDVTKAKMHGSNSTKLMVNLNGLKALNGKEAEFVGLIMWSRKTCNQDFIDKVADGTVTFDILDKFDADNSADSYYKTTDQFHLMLTGLDQLALTGDELASCIAGGQVGWAEVSDSTGIAATTDYTCLAGWHKTLRN